MYFYIIDEKSLTWICLANSSPEILGGYVKTWKYFCLYMPATTPTNESYVSISDNRCIDAGIYVIRGTALWCLLIFHMMTWSNGTIFHHSGHLCGEFTGLRWLPRTKASDARFDAFFNPITSDFSREQFEITEYTRFLMFSAAEVVHTESVYISTRCDVQ